MFLLSAFIILIFAHDAQAAVLAIAIGGAALGAGAGISFGLTGLALLQAASVGWAIGSTIGNLFFGPKLPTVYGPRLSDKTVQSAAFGQHITKLWGTDRIAAQIIFSSGLKETKHKKKLGGKGLGGGSQTQITYSYAVDVMLAFSRRARGVRRVWADTKLIYDVSDATGLEAAVASNKRNMAVRNGSESQLPSALEESYFGAGQVSAHRGLFCLEYPDFQLADFGNRTPNFTAEIYTEGEEDFGLIGAYTAPPPENNKWWLSSWGKIDPHGEIYAFYLPASQGFASEQARLFHWTPAAPDDPEEETRIPVTWHQTISTAWVVRVRSDEHSYAFHGSTNTGGLGGHVLAYYSVDQQTELLIPQSELGANHTSANFLLKRGDQIHVVTGAGYLYLGPEPNHLMVFNALGVKLDESRVIDDNAGGGDCRDIVRTENYLWALVSGANKLLKIDPDTLELVSSIDLTGIPNALAVAAVSDAEIYVMSANASTVSFYLIANEGAPVLYQQAATTSFSGQHTFPFYGLRYLNGIFVVDFDGFTSGFEAFIEFYGASAETFDIPLWKIVRDINVMAGLDSEVTMTLMSIPPSEGDIAVSELTDMVHGYALTRAMTAREALLQLQQTYFFDARERNLKLDYPKRGKPVVASLPESDLAARSSLSEQLPDRLTIQRSRETELPLRVHVVYNNWEFSYQPGHEYAPRLITEAKATVTVEIAVAITSTKARQVADALLALAWLERESFSLRVSRKYLLLDAADNIEVVITDAD